MTNTIVAFISKNITKLSTGVLLRQITHVHLSIITLALFCSAQTKQLDHLLNRKLSLDVYASERLESILFRLELHTESRITFKVQEMFPYKAKAAKYKNIPLKKILDEQLANTPFSYKIYKKKLLIYDISKR